MDDYCNGDAHRGFTDLRGEPAPVAAFHHPGCRNSGPPAPPDPLESQVMTRRSMGLLLAVACLTSCTATPPPAPAPGPGPAASALPEPVAEADITVFHARKIITMEPALPEARVVAVRDGRILGVGRDLGDLRAWIADEPYRLDGTLADKVLLPGLIDPHLHPMLGALLLPMEVIAPTDWELPGGVAPGVLDRANYLAKLRALAADWPDPKKPILTWGYHDLWHGKLRRADLDAISDTIPIIVFQRSFHEQILNTPALRLGGIDPDAETTLELPPGVDPAHIDVEGGHFMETAAPVVLSRYGSILFAPERVAEGLAIVREMAHRAGITTIADMALGLTGDMDAEATLFTRVFELGDAPFRLVLIPTAGVMALTGLEGDELVVAAAALSARHGSDRIRIGGHIKLLADGAFYARLMQMGPPGYPDDQHGAWLTEPDVLMQQARAFWNAGYDIHIHVNGDAGLDVVLDTLAALLEEKNRPDHRVSLEHLGFATEDQTRRIARLGAVVSAQPYYLYVLGDKYADLGLGWDRASQIARLGSLVRKNVPVTLHSDLPMAPSQPLRLAWVAANRVTMNGTLMAPSERLTVEQALRAITIDAAWVLRMEDEIGSIRAGKRADFAVLEADPYEVGAAGLADIGIWGTVFEGALRPVD